MKTHISCMSMTSKFAWQLSDSIWITYWTIGYLGSLEVWYLINHFNCLNFISIAYLINFGSNAEKCGRSRGVKLYWFIFSGPKCSPMQGGLWWNWYLGKRAHPTQHVWKAHSTNVNKQIGSFTAFIIKQSKFRPEIVFRGAKCKQLVQKS